ncbi:hypothetical protein [Tautonia marina]|uniref:hypothetical protein n=1 Tax=Tautonia marina TaxID=2653855 RepID=UPI0012609502|nr:hypothetical protein [Tautonia marina]
MASANESQGLKIAVAIFVSLTVILAVTSYFLYSEYSKANQDATTARNEATQANTKASQANNNLISVLDRAGYQVQSDTAAVLTTIDTDQQALVASLSEQLAEANQTIQQAQQDGATGTEVARYRENLTGLIQTFTDESTLSPTLKGSLETLAALTANQSRLATALATDNVRLRRQLENVDNVNQAELNRQQQAAQTAQTDLQNEHQKYEGLFEEQRDQLSQLQRQVAELRVQNDGLTTNLASQKADYEDRISDILEQMKYWRDQSEKTEVVLDNADGYVTFVDYTTRRIRTNLTRSMGARPQMILSVFDADAPGLPSDKPKARIKLIDVGNQETVASIEEQFDKNNPLRVGDQLYSAAWSPDGPQRFALIGKIDMNRDGVDDREDLKRLIQAAGGVVDYDLPTPSVGQEQGELNAKISYYIIDERDPIRTPSNMRSVQEMNLDDMAFATTRTEVIEEARRLGLRPLPVERLLSSLGYSYGMTIPGVVEAADTEAIERLLNPEGTTVPLPGTEEFERRRQEAEANSPF